MTEQDAIELAQSRPATVQSISTDLAAVGVSEGSVLLVHSSLSSLGWVCGGAVAVIEALKKTVGPSGTVVMPTHSADLSEPSLWEDPPVPRHWWPIIRNSLPAFDVAVTPTRCMGAIAECFRKYPGVIRSEHPHVSFAAYGPRAERITCDHQLDDGLGNNSPLGQLYELRAWVLLFGVGHDRNTSLHLCERRAFGENGPTITSGAPMRIHGQRGWIEFTEPKLDDSDFHEIGEAFAAVTGLVRTGSIAAGHAMLMPQRALVDFGTRWIMDHRVTNAIEQTHAPELKNVGAERRP